MEEALTHEYTYVSYSPLRKFLIGSFFVVTILCMVAIAMNVHGIHAPVSLYAFLPK